MIDALPLLLADDGYQISRSVRLRSSASAYFNRTPASAGNRRTWTWSGWHKRGTIPSGPVLMHTNQAVNFDGNAIAFGVQVNDDFGIVETSGGSNTIRVATSALYRDPSAWYHLMVSVDTTQATASNRVRLFVNGVQQTALSIATYPSLNADTLVNQSGKEMGLGRQITTGGGAGGYLDGYLTEINFIDGQALTPSSFGESNSTTGVWQPKKYTGTYGTNGFYLNFSDNSNNTAATIGKDYSGNGNNWTPNNISVTSGATYDSMLDVPTPWADGGNGRGNYCTLNPINPPNSVTISGGNLNFACADDTTPREAFATFGVRTGKWYFEATKTNSCDRFYAGIIESIYKPGQGISFGKLRFDTSTSSNKTVMFAVDFNAGLYWGGVDGTWTGDPSAGTGGTSFTVGSNEWVALVGGYRETQPSAVGNANFGQRPFAYTPPSGFRALNTLNLPEPTIKKGNLYFDVITYTGDGTSNRTITSSLGFTPDLAWGKSRSAVLSHALVDSVRGNYQTLSSNSTAAESAINSYNLSTANSLITFNSNETNQNGTTYATWLWREGATQGFDIVTFTGTGAAQNISHSLGVAPRMMIVKPRSGSGSWAVYHASIGAGNAVWLNLTDASASYPTVWNSTAPTSSQFTVGSFTNNGVTFVAYLFSDVAGFSRFGSYTGNGSTDGPFVFCGFAPAFIMLKRTDSTGNWTMYDRARSTRNPDTKVLYPNLSNAEDASTDHFDWLSNGFKMKSTNQNTNGGTFIFMAMAEHPFKLSLAR